MKEEQASPSEWAVHASGPASLDSLAALAAADPSTLTGCDLIDAIVASEKALSSIAGTQMRLMAALAEPFAAGDPMRLAARIARKNSMNEDDPDRIQLCVPDAAASLAASEIAAALRISPVTAGIRVRDAATMVTELAPTLQAMEEGRIDRGKARVIADHCQPLTPEHTAEVQDLVLPTADQLSTSELRDLTGQAVITVDPAGAEERHQAAAARRDLTLRAQPDAMATLNAFLPADGAVKIFQISDLLATGTAGAAGDVRGIGARRVDALVDIADHLLTNGYLDLSHYIDNSGPGYADSDHAEADTAENDQDPANGPVVGDAAQQDGEMNGPDAEFTVSARPDRADLETSNRNNTCNAHPDPARSDQADPDLTANAHPDPAPARSDRVDIDDRRPDLSIPSGRPVDSGSEHNNWKARLENVLNPPVQSEGPVKRPSTPTAAHPDRGANHFPATTFKREPQKREPSPGRRRVLSRQGRRPHLSVVIGLGTFTGENELPAHLAGFGAIPASLGRAIATSAGTVTALFADRETGVVTDAGALTYRPSQQLRDKVAALTPICQFPSCRQPVWRCDIDHREAFDHQDPQRGGRTDQENTGPFCRRHHLIKHHTEWRFRVDPNRFIVEWISPTGHRYLKKTQPALLPDLRVSTAGTATAERLDLITTIAARTSMPEGETEELLKTLLLRHQHEQQRLEYEHVPTGLDHDSSELTDNDESDPTDLDDPPPPF